MFCFQQLQNPHQTEIDAIEFLEGTKQALASEAATVHSLDFVNFVVNRNGPKTKYMAGASAKAFTTPALYRVRERAVKTHYHVDKLIMELQDMAIESAHIRDVRYSQLTENEYKNEVENGVIPSAVRSRDATLEKLQIGVNFEATTVAKYTWLKKKEKDVVVQQQSTHTCVFESRVTTPDDVAWRIAGIMKADKATKRL